MQGETVNLQESIPISASWAESFSMPTNFTSPTYVNYGLGLFGAASGEANPIQPTSATSAAAVGPQQAYSPGASQTNPVLQNELNQMPSNLMLLLGVVAIGIVAVAIILKH